MVYFTEEPVAQGEALLQPSDSMLERADIAGHLLHIVERNARSPVELVEQQVGQGRLGAFDLTGEHGLATDVVIQKKVRLG